MEEAEEMNGIYTTEYLGVGVPLTEMVEIIKM